MSDIFRHRGDTTVIQRTITGNTGAVLNINGWNLVLTLNSVAMPVDASGQMAQIIGVITDGLNGVVEFPPEAADVDRVGSFFFDIQAVDGGGVVSTIDHGQFILNQDITKSQPQQTFIPSGTIGEAYPTDASDIFRVWCDGADDTESKMVYRVRDSVPVIAWEGPQAGVWWTFEFAGALAVGGPWGPIGVWEYTMLVYWNVGARILFRSDLYDICHTLMSCSDDRIRLECESYHPYGTDDSSENVNFMFGAARTVDEWAAMRYRIDCDTPQVSGKVWYPADPVNWEADEPVGWEGQVGLATAPLRTILPVRFECQGGGPGAVFDIARIGWERLS